MLPNVVNITRFTKLSVSWDLASFGRVAYSGGSLQYIAYSLLHGSVTYSGNSRSFAAVFYKIEKVEVERHLLNSAVFSGFVCYAQTQKLYRSFPYIILIVVLKSSLITLDRLLSIVTFSKFNMASLLVNYSIHVH